MSFKDSYVDYATLYVPEGSVAAYKATEPWSGFGTIKTLSGEIPVVEKCATPTITYKDGKVSFSCDTEGVEFFSEVSVPTTVKKYDREITLGITAGEDSFYMTGERDKLLFKVCYLFLSHISGCRAEQRAE